jgi:hypothetical protein
MFSAAGDYELALTADDGELSASASVRIQVTDVKPAPVATPDSYSVGEDTTLTVGAPGVLGNDTGAGGGLHALLVSLPNHGTLTLGANGGFAYTPAPNYNGPDSFTYKDNDGTADSNMATVSIAVGPVNDAPSFAKGADQTVPQDSGAKAVAAWAINVSAGPSDESSQTVNFIVNNDNATLFSGQPAVGPSGTLTFTPAAGANGLAHVTVRLRDNGGSANGGVDSSAAQTFTVTIQPKPSLSIADASVVEGDSGTTPMVFIVTLSAASASPVTVGYATLNGTASSRDYGSTSGTLTFAAGETSKTVTVLVFGDTSKENKETLSVRLSNPINATITRVSAIGTIVDDE